jgi:hypothetical protein
MLFINTELIFFNADLLLVTAGIKKIPTLGLKDSQPGTKTVPRREFLFGTRNGQLREVSTKNQQTAFKR